MSTRRIVLALCLVAWVAIPTAGLAGRQTIVERRAKPAVSFAPSAGANDALDAAVLSGLDYAAVAPPGARLRVVEDEPYIYLRGRSESRHEHDYHGLSSITLRSDRADGGWYEARINLRTAPGKGSDNPLRLSFDTSAAYAYQHSMLAAEQRGEVIYALSEVRSPLGLAFSEDKDNRHREYFAYSAAVLNPQQYETPAANEIAVGTELYAIPDLANGATQMPSTPYQYVQGQLKVLRRITRTYCLLTIDVSAADFPHSLTLTENLARCVINRIDPELPEKHRLEYLAYYPEYEPFIPYYDGEQPDPRTADLAERPGEGCGNEAQPITGDACPACNDPLSWPARPYADADYSYTLPPGSLPSCSHCLLLPGMGKYEAVDQLRLLRACSGTSQCCGVSDCTCSAQRNCPARCATRRCTPRCSGCD